MGTRDQGKNLGVRVPKRLHTALKVEAATNGTSIREIVIDALEEKLGLPKSGSRDDSSHDIG